VIAAMKEEYEALLDVQTGIAPGSEWAEEKGPHGREISFCNFLHADGKNEMRVGATFATEMGQVAATDVAVPLLEKYKVRCLAMCGICAGRRGKVNLGDVIIAERLWVYDNGKIIVEYDGPEGAPLTTLLRDIKTYNLDDNWNRAARGWKPPPDAPWPVDRPYTYEQQELWVLERLSKDPEADPRKHEDAKTHSADWEKILERLWKNGDV